MSASAPFDPAAPPGGILVLGLGNLLLGDEAVGLHALRRLEAELGVDPRLTLVDGGTAGLELLPLLQDHGRVLLLDALLVADQPPGTVHLLRGAAIRRALEVKLTLHHLGLSDVLALLELTGGRQPELALIGVVPERLELDLDLSPTVAAALPEVLALARAVLAEWSA